MAYFSQFLIPKKLRALKRFIGNIQANQTVYHVSQIGNVLDEYLRMYDDITKAAHDSDIENYAPRLKAEEVLGSTLGIRRQIQMIVDNATVLISYLDEQEFTELEKEIGNNPAVSTSGQGMPEGDLVEVFISHGKITRAFNKLEEFLRALGCKPTYDISEPSEGRTINQQVAKLMSEADFYIILATGETKNEKDETLPSHNVTIEYDRLREAQKHNMLVLLEKDTKMPSMLQDTIYESFSQESMDAAFTKLVRELRHHNLF